MIDVLSLNRDQFAVVLEALRRRLRRGEWVEGGPLTVAEIADQCGVSATPVREALARLAGEGLVRDHRGRGFEARRIDTVDLADLYRSQMALADMVARAASRWGRSAIGVVPAANDFLIDPVGAWEGAFDGLLRRTQASFFLCQQHRLADRLAPARRVEPLVLGETAADFAPLSAALALDDFVAVTTALEPLHQRRLTSLEGLVAAMRLSPEEYKTSI